MLTNISLTLSYMAWNNHGKLLLAKKYRNPKILAGYASRCYIPEVLHVDACFA